MATGPSQWINVVQIFVMSLYYSVKFHGAQVLTNHEYIFQNKYRIINLLQGT